MSFTRFQNKNQIKVLLIDLDGTLLGSWDILAHVRFIRMALWNLRKVNGLKAALKLLMELNYIVKAPVIKITQPNLNENSFNQSNTVTNSQKFITTVSNFFKVPIENAEKVLSEILFNVFPELEPFFYPISGAREFLDWAKSKYKLILATQPVWPQEIIEMRCKWAKIDPKIFSSITHSSRMSFFKPDTKYYEQILEQENLKPDECLMIGNDLKNDLAAVKVGIPVFIVNKKNFLKEIKTPDAKAQALSGNFKILRQILEN